MTKTTSLSFFLLFNFIFTFSIMLQARDLTEVQLYRRCYAQLVGESPSLSDPNLLAIQNKTKTGLQGCQDILDRMKIDPNDAQGKLADQTDAVALKALRNMYKVTGTFTKSRRFEGGVTNYFEDFASTEEVFDNSALALAYTENIFNENRNFKDLFSITKEPRAVRQVDPLFYSTAFTMNAMYGTKAAGDLSVINSPRSRHGQTFYSDVSQTTPVNPDSIPFGFVNSTAGTYTTQNITQISIGELIGINYNTPAEMITRNPNTYGFATLGFDVHSNIAKGVFGSRPYLIANTNWSDNSSPNLQFMYRRLAQAIIKDFTCRDLPVLRESDITDLVSADANALPFRKAASCVKCHATMDQMAGSFRNLTLMKSGNRGTAILEKFFVVPHVINQQLTTSETGWPIYQDNDYYKRPVKGSFNFRTYDGKLVKSSLTDFNSLVNAVTATDDVYICYAQKMFKYLTGVDVYMFDTGDPANSTIMSAYNKKDWDYRNFVIQLGLNLKQHQKSKVLMKEIMSSPFYKISNFGKE